MHAVILKRFARERAANAIRAQVRRIVEFSRDWLISPELYRLGVILREAANEIDRAADERNGVGRRA